MAISGFGRGKDGTKTTTAAPVASSSSSSGGGLGNLTAFIDQGSEFEGKLSFKDTVRIDGSFSGEISSDNTLIVGETGEITATIRSVCVVISGTVEGDIDAQEQVVLHKSAVVNGNIQASTLVMEEGAQLNGGVRMSGRGASAPAAAPAQPANGSGSKGSPDGGKSS